MCAPGDPSTTLLYRAPPSILSQVRRRWKITPNSFNRHRIVPPPSTDPVQVVMMILVDNIGGYFGDHLAR